MSKSKNTTNIKGRRMMKIKGLFIEDLEALEEHYQSKFQNYSILYNFEGKENAKQKMEDYKNCCKKINQVLKFADKLD